MKKTIVHIIDNLARGGAETMLVTVTKNLPEYNNIIVTLYPQNEFGSELHCDKLVCLNLSSPLMIPMAALKLRALIKEHKVDIVHSHLFWSTVVARLGVPKKIPLITTIHTFVKTSVEYQPWRMRVLEKLTYLCRKNVIIAVAKGALDEYFDFIKVKPYKAFALYTFVDTAIFNDQLTHVPKPAGDTFKIVTVGNLKVQKNHQFLLTAFRQMAAPPWSVSPTTTSDQQKSSIHLDIYGNGPLDISLQKMIDEYQLSVTLKGQVTDIQKIIGQYDLYVMSSLYEGFALSVLEAMALGMPLLLSDIPSFKEQCEIAAVYFTLADPADFVAKLMELKSNPKRLDELGKAAKNRATSLFTLTQHIDQLKIIYSNTLKDYGR
jgi:glycosyltransferase involved in cell wall biosynthesis